MNRITIGILAAFTMVAVAGAEPQIQVGDHYLLPNATQQVIELYVTGVDMVEGLEFNVQIGGGTSGPIFEDVDILTGTIFANNNQGIYAGSYISPRWAYQGTVTDSGTVLADGLLATLTLDTTGLWDGEYLLSLTDTPEGSTNFAGVAIDITDGWIHIPEPASCLTILLGIGLIVRRRSGHNKSRSGQHRPGA